MFTFGDNPARTDIGHGLRDAFVFMRASWRRWLPVVVALAVAELIVYAFVGRVDIRLLTVTDPVTGLPKMTGDSTVVVRWLVGTAAGFALGLVAGWAFIAIAIAGMRERELTARWVLRRGLMTAGFYALFYLVAVLLALLGATSVVIIASRIYLLGLLALVVLAATALYGYLRFVFAGIAIFDGHGLGGAVGETWRLSARSTGRLLGWGLLAMFIALGALAVVGLPAALLPGGSLGVLSVVPTALVGYTASCFDTYLLAVLYESQRARRDPALYPEPEDRPWDQEHSLLLGERRQRIPDEEFDWTGPIPDTDTGAGEADEPKRRRPKAPRIVY